MPATERNANLHAAAVDQPRQNGTLPANTQFQPLQMSLDGVLWNTIAAQSGGPGGTSTPVTLDEYSTDAIPPSTLETAGLTVSAGMRALNAAGNVDRLRTLATDADAQVAAQIGLLGAVMRPQIYNGATFDRQRAPVLFRSGAASALGSTALIAGVAGQRIRLLRYIVQISSNVAAAAAAIEAVQFFDGAVNTFLRHEFFVPAVSVVTGFGAHTTGWIDLGPIGLLLGVGNGLNTNLTIALTAGQVLVAVAFVQGVTT